MPRYLVDVNLPRFFGQWNSSEYIHQLEIEATMPDQQIWEYARKHDLTIISKDSDFSSRILLSDPPPKVIHIRLGNMSMRQFHEAIARSWEQVLELNTTHKLVIVFNDRIMSVR
jgi:predicted nuclease of predicted toxin-antitoxin system